MLCLRAEPECIAEKERRIVEELATEVEEQVQDRVAVFGLLELLLGGKGKVFKCVSSKCLKVLIATSSP